MLLLPCDKAVFPLTGSSIFLLEVSVMPLCHGIVLLSDILDFYSGLWHLTSKTKRRGPDLCW